MGTWGRASEVPDEPAADALKTVAEGLAFHIKRAVDRVQAEELRLIELRTEFERTRQGWAAEEHQAKMETFRQLQTMSVETREASASMKRGAGEIDRLIAEGK